MGPTTVTWRGLTMQTGQSARFRVTGLEGWEDRPPARWEKTPRANHHGAHPSRVLADERIVTVTGHCWTAADRDGLIDELQAAAGFDLGDDTEPLTVTAAGRTLTGGGQLVAAAPALLRGEWGVGRFGWVLQWRCPDPLRYGPPVTVSTGLPTTGGGLVFPLFAGAAGVGLDFGQLGDPGQVTLTNPGTAAAPILFAVRGDLPSGFELSTPAGGRLRYPVPVPGAQTIDLDTAAGTVMVEGTASRRGNLTVADWLHVPARGALTVQFTSLGGFDPAARVDATVRASYW